MTALGRASLLCAIALVLTTGCSRSPRPMPSESPSGPATCDVRFEAPPGFKTTERFQDRYSDRVGVRIGFRDQAGREIHYFAGIPGEFGEGLPGRGFVTVATGEQGRLLGRIDTWILAWDTSGPCASHAVLGHGFTRVAFLRLLRTSGVLSG